MNYNEWKEKIIYLRDKIILPGGGTVNKARWMTSNGFNNKGFNEYLNDLYNAKYKDNDAK